MVILNEKFLSDFVGGCEKLILANLIQVIFGSDDGDGRRRAALATLSPRWVGGGCARARSDEQLEPPDWLGAGRDARAAAAVRSRSSRKISSLAAVLAVPATTADSRRYDVKKARMC